MIRRLLLWLTARLPVKVIGREAAYAEWYHVATLFGLVRIQIHRFLRSDPDGLHDHPWGWSRSIILAGWYLEERRDRTRVRSAGSTYGMRGDTFHRVVLPAGAREAWTLFIHGPYVKHWGFITPTTMKADTGGLRELTWYDREGQRWHYQARDRSAHRFDPWPWSPSTKRGRELRAKREPGPAYCCDGCGRTYYRAGPCDWCLDQMVRPISDRVLAALE